MQSILYIFLPCKKVYPIGVTYLADFIHRRKPDVRQRILDLSLFSAAQRSSAVRDAATEFKPDLVCFSWRDIQIFSPTREIPRWNMRLISTLPAIRSSESWLRLRGYNSSIGTTVILGRPSPTPG